MILKVNDDLKKRFWEYVSHEESINLFIIGDVESYGFDTDFQEVWFQVNEKDNITSVILKYYSSLIVYSYENNFNIDELIKHIDNLDISIINGKKSVIDRLISKYKKFKSKKECYFCSLKKLEDIDLSRMSHYKIEEASIDDLNKVYNFLSNIEDFDTDNYIESKTHQLKTNSARVYYIKEEKKIINSVSTGIETSFLAMLTGVATNKMYRNKGLATYSVYKLSEELLSEGKTPCLFYSNLESGSIYHKIGYKQEDNWIMLFK